MQRYQTKATFGVLGLVCAAVLVGGSVGSVLAQPTSAPVATEMPKWMAALKVTPAQAESMIAVQAKYKPMVQEMQTELNQAEESLENLLVTGASNDEIRTQHEKVLDLKKKIDMTRLESALEIKEILTLEQRQMLSTMTRQRLVNLRDHLRNGSQ
ncbi:Spy/CpxP family protein refolding chaperone [Candidatus Synechococcus calcipolaris G9]|uniref:Spy/CpxP family protein refolding chaperone n=1 Tax=Candidatus Synechococcus calcipolaris G9 TaxID=1497997 RepID=A0ABT6EYS4_9SYNE|nr:Spy/CpxP family protein refolding chaperone [Candidatus Synechococcus calcipolaris]MDG2990333.1 Spy/CpxP family protein refolding chaperone [Candidatus Synechococcus calcipolaris G9]